MSKTLSKYLENFQKSNMDEYFESQRLHYLGKGEDQLVFILDRFPNISPNDSEMLLLSLWPCQLSSFKFLITPEFHQNPNRYVAVDLKFGNLIPELWRLGLETLSWEFFGDMNGMTFNPKKRDTTSIYDKLVQIFGQNIQSYISCSENYIYLYFGDNFLLEMHRTLGVTVSKLGDKGFIYNREDLELLTRDRKVNRLFPLKDIQ